MRAATEPAQGSVAEPTTGPANGKDGEHRRAQSLGVAKKTRLLYSPGPRRAESHSLQRLSSYRHARESSGKSQGP